MPARDTVYPFSFTTDWFHTVNAVAPINAASPPPANRTHRSLIQRLRICSVTRNHIPAATALHSAANTLTRAATLPAIGSTANNRPTMTKNGFPGGCGSPNVYAAVMYSLVSHIAVDGAMVTRYIASTTAAAIAAAP